MICWKTWNETGEDSTALKPRESGPFLLFYFSFCFLLFFFLGLFSCGIGSFSLYSGQCHIQVWGGETSV
ncbi:hypothetical protein Hanom_Chr00s000001g01595201 [Helianthus anomalus]